MFGGVFPVRPALSRLIIAAAIAVALAFGTSAAQADTYSTTVEADSPVLYLPLSETSGTPGNLGSDTGATVSNSLSLGNPGPLPDGSSYSGHAGSGSEYLSVTPTATVSNAFSVEVFFELDSASASGKLFGSRSPEFGVDGDVSATELHADLGDGGGWWTTDASAQIHQLAPNVWHQAVFTVSIGPYDAFWTWYLDGAEVGNGAVGNGTPIPVMSPSRPMYFAYNGNDGALGANGGGKLSELAVYNYALSTSQVAAHWSAAGGPTNTTLPAIAGQTQAGDTLVASPGSWSNANSYAYQWEDCNGSSCSPISGATSSTYTLTANDVGHQVEVVVTGLDSPLQSSATSSPTATVTAVPPASTAPPTISGYSMVGEQLSSTTGSWSGTAPSYSYQWLRCDGQGQSCQNVSGATSSTYTPTSSDLSSELEVQVTATNSAGTASATSSPTSAVGPNSALVDSTYNSGAGQANLKFGGAAVLDGSGGLLVSSSVGWYDPGLGYNTGEAAVTRYLPSGQLDTNFAGSGEWQSQSQTGAPVVADSSNGHIIVASANGAYPNAMPTIWCLTSTGGACPVFGPQNALTFPYDAGGAIATVPGNTGNLSNDIYIAGTNAHGLAVERLGPTGALDTAYGNNNPSGGNGVVNVSGADAPALAAIPDGSLYVAVPQNGMTVYRLTADGSVDSAWNGGSVTLNTGTAGNQSGSLATLPTGELLIAATAEQNGTYGANLARLAPDGSVEWTTFVPASSSYTASLENIAARPDGGALLSFTVASIPGQSWTHTAAVASVNPNGRMDPTMAGSGVADYSTNNPPLEAGPLVMSGGNSPQPLLVGGAYSYCNGSPDSCVQPAIFRLDGSSTWDTPLTKPFLNGQPRNGNAAGVQDPVNAATGNVYSSAQDLELNGRGPAALWLRTYNSDDPTPGPYGYGWTTDYNTSLTPNADGSVTERDPEGAQLVFPKSGGGYTAPAGIRDVLTQNSDGSYTLTKPNGVQWDFNAGGQLSSIVDTNGNTLTLGYTNGQLTSLTNASGRTMTLAYSGGYLQSITDGTRTVSYTYDSGGNLATVTDPNGKVTTYQYDDNHLLTDILTPGNSTDPGEDQHFTYDSQGRALTASGKNNAHYAAFAYNTPAAGETTITDANGNESIYAYDSTGDITSITDPYGKTQSWGWTNGLKTSYTDQLGNTTNYKYDSNGNMVEMDQPAPTSGGSALVTKWAYGAFNEMTDEWDPNNDHAVWAYDSRGNLASETDPDGNKTTYTYDSQGDMLTKTTQQGSDVQNGSQGTTSTYTYDPTTGELDSVEDPEGNTTNYGYDALGRRTSVTTPNLATTTYAYDNDSNVTSITYPAASQGAQQGTVTMGYDPRNNLTSVTDQNGHTTTMTYDPQNSLLTKTDADGRTTTYTYDAEEKPLTVTDNAGNVTSYTYDKVERLVKLVRPDGTQQGSETDASYYPNGQVNTVTDPDGNVTAYGYDNDGRLTTVTDALLHQTTYTYDAAGNKLTSTDPDGKTTTYTYDADGNVLTKTDPLSHTWTYTYVAGHLSKQVDANGQETDYTYDSLGHLINEAFPGSSATTLQWSFDPDGNLQQTVDGTGTTTYHYDALDRLTEKDLPGGSKLSYSYDLAGNRTGLTLPGQSTAIQYAYDHADLLSSVTDAASHQTTFDYTKVGQLQDVSYPNGAAEHYAYDPMGRVSSVENDAGNGSGGQGAVISKLTYAYDKASNTTGSTDQNQAQASYAYDALNRLTSESSPAGFAVSGSLAVSRSYTYDNAGNRTSLTSGSQTTTYSYNNAEQLTSAAVSGGQTATYGYNNDGELTSEQVGSGTPTTFCYDPEGDLTQASSDSYVYDINGNRVSETENGVTTTQTFDGSNVVQQTSGGSTTNYLYGADGLVFQTDPTGNVSYYGHDALGSVVALTSGSTGAVTDQYAWDAFGENVAHAGSSAQPFGFMGNQTDPTTGLDNFNAREYDPSTGRFISMDPVPGNPTSPQSLNRYAYGWANPFASPDPSGLWPGWLDDATRWISNADATVLSAPFRAAGISQSDIASGYLAVGSYLPVSQETEYYLNNANCMTAADWGTLAFMGVSDSRATQRPVRPRERSPMWQLTRRRGTRCIVASMKAIMPTTKRRKA
jgi:RHS repeat-associated protein